jgi:enoyl reductase-like protein
MTAMAAKNLVVAAKAAQEVAVTKGTSGGSWEGTMRLTATAVASLRSDLGLD